MQQCEAKPHEQALTDALTLVESEMQRVLSSIDLGQLANAAERICSSNRVFLAGAGRSGLALKMVAMRLMHLGLQAYVAGNVTTPAIAEGDLLVVASASGSTSSMVHAAEVARKVSTNVLLITTAPDSTLGRMASDVIVVSAASKGDVQRRGSEQYAGSLFEQAVLLTFDAVFHALWRSGHQSAQELLRRHANLE